MAKANTLQLKVGDTIKVGRREFIIQHGDHIMDNGSSNCFVAGDRRTLFFTKNGRYNNSHHYIDLPKKLIKQIDLTLLLLTDNKTYNVKRYYFKS